MSLHRFFLDNQVLSTETEPVFPLRLAADDARHARVLRLRQGEHIAVIDATSDYFECEIVEFSDEIPLVRIARHEVADDTRPSVLLVQGLAKGDKMDEVIRHASELGVAGFVPLTCERSVVKLDAKKAASRTQRWQAVAKSAAMQSGQPSVPEVTEPQTLEAVCELVHNATAVLVFWEEAPASARLANALKHALETTTTLPCDARVAVVVGPEGGLTQHEANRLLECNPRSSLVSLGSSILRTETAGIVAPALVLYELGALG